MEEAERTRTGINSLKIRYNRVYPFERGVTAFSFARRHARAFSVAGGAMLVAVGILEVTGAWSSALLWLKTHWISSYQSPL